MATTFRWRAVVFQAMLAYGCFGAISAFGQAEAESLSKSFRDATKRVLPAVVTVHSIGQGPAAGPFEGRPPGGPGLGPGPGPGAGPAPGRLLPPGFGPEPPPRRAGGSGVVIDAAKGYILTNDHVVNGGTRTVVIFEDGRERSVSQIRRDPKSDLALLIVEGKDLVAAEWGDSSALDIGDWVLAVGQPFGLSGTVTAGIVSGKGRGIGVAMYEDLIQTDAAINPGNSGGPLINLKGEVVGINTAIKTMGGGYEGVGFAIPAVRARRVAMDLIEHGKVRRAYLGIQIGPVDQDRGERLKQAQAVSINGVTPDSPASAAGLVRDDVILKLDGKPVAGPSALQAAIEFAPVDKPVTLTIDRDGESREVTITPKPQPESFGLPESFESPEDAPGGPRFRPGPGGEPPLEIGPGARRFRGPRRDGLARPGEPRETRFQTNVPFPRVGMRLSEVPAALGRRDRFDERRRGGLAIVGVELDGPADRGGLEPGMIITRAGDRDVDSIDDFRKALDDGISPPGLVVQIRRGPKTEIRLIPQQEREPEQKQDQEPKSDQEQPQPQPESERGGSESPGRETGPAAL